MSVMPWGSNRGSRSKKLEPSNMNLVRLLYSTMDGAQGMVKFAVRNGLRVAIKSSDYVDYTVELEKTGGLTTLTCASLSTSTITAAS